MNGTRPEQAYGEGANASWADESLPLSVRKELLQRELTKLGVRKTPSHAGSGASGSGRPQADAPVDSAHGD